MDEWEHVEVTRNGRRHVDPENVAADERVKKIIDEAAGVDLVAVSVANS